jgi:asparagine synthetase B (glutamine-hydrolysing)
VAGAIAIIVVLALFPVLILMSGGLASSIIGAVLQRDGEVRHEGSELLELDD